MTLAEAITKIEAWFIVHDERGIETGWTDQNDKTVAMGARDMETAPNGEPYEVMTSFGLHARLPEHALVMFQDEGLAVQWWIDEVEAYAHTQDTKQDRSTWPRLHLYWRDKPAFHKVTYLAMSQAELLQTASPLGAVLQLDMGFVWSRMLISAIGPDGEES